MPGAQPATRGLMSIDRAYDRNITGQVLPPIYDRQGNMFPGYITSDLGNPSMFSYNPPGEGPNPFDQYIGSYTLPPLATPTPAPTPTPGPTPNLMGSNLGNMVTAGISDAGQGTGISVEPAILPGNQPGNPNFVPFAPSTPTDSFDPMSMGTPGTIFGTGTSLSDFSLGAPLPTDYSALGIPGSDFSNVGLGNIMVDPTLFPSGDPTVQLFTDQSPSPGSVVDNPFIDTGAASPGIISDNPFATPDTSGGAGTATSNPYTSNIVGYTPDGQPIYGNTPLASNITGFAPNGEPIYASTPVGPIPTTGMFAPGGPFSGSGTGTAGGVGPQFSPGIPPNPNAPVGPQGVNLGGANAQFPSGQYGTGYGQGGSTGQYSPGAYSTLMSAGLSSGIAPIGGPGVVIGPQLTGEDITLGGHGQIYGYAPNTTSPWSPPQPIKNPDWATLHPNWVNTAFIFPTGSTTAPTTQSLAQDSSSPAQAYGSTRGPAKRLQ